MIMKAKKVLLTKVQPLSLRHKVLYMFTISQAIHERSSEVRPLTAQIISTPPYILLEEADVCLTFMASSDTPENVTL